MSGDNSGDIVTVRAAVKSDLPEILDFVETPFDKRLERHQLEIELKKGAPAFVAEAGGKMVGYLVYAKNNSPAILTVKSKGKPLGVKTDLIKFLMTEVIPEAATVTFGVRMKDTETQDILMENHEYKRGSVYIGTENGDFITFRPPTPKAEIESEDRSWLSSLNTYDQDDGPPTKGFKALPRKEHLQKSLDRLKELTGGMEWALAYPVEKDSSAPKKGEDGYKPMTAADAYLSMTLDAAADSDLSEIVFKTRGKLKYPKEAVVAINELVKPRSEERSFSTKVSINEPRQKIRGVDTLAEPVPIVIPAKSMRMIHLDGRIISDKLRRKLVEKFEPVDPAQHKVWAENMAKFAAKPEITKSTAEASR